MLIFYLSLVVGINISVAFLFISPELALKPLILLWIKGQTLLTCIWMRFLNTFRT